MLSFGYYSQTSLYDIEVMHKILKQYLLDIINKPVGFKDSRYLFYIIN